MSFRSWLQNLLSTLAMGRGRRKHRRWGSLGTAMYRPNLEVLENRLTPSFTYFGDYPAEEFYQMTGADLASAYAPGSLNSADFNSDGWNDLFAVDFPGMGDYPVASIYFNRGDGTFELYESVYAGPDPRWFATGDFNIPGSPADGLPDYAIYNYPDAVSVYRNNGPWVSIGDVTVTEGDTGTANATFMLSLEYAKDVDVTVYYATEDISATAGSDYVAASGEVIIPAGQTSATITVAVIGDSLPEPNETLWVRLTGATNAAVNPWNALGYGTILDDEPRISISDATVKEGNTVTANATFTLTLSEPSDFDVTVHYDTADGTAMAGSDYIAASGDVTIPAGQISQTFTVAVNGDRLPEPTETFAVNLSTATNASLSDGQGIASILDDEPRISISNVIQKEGNGKKTTLFVFTVTLSTAYDQPVTMSYRMVDGTATSGDQDYVAKTGTLTFAPGETTKTITIEVKGDNKKEASEAFYLDLFGNSINSLFTKNRGLGTILNDD